jgi:phosphatidylserine/phosphatidylglycerophosphate/cardiolipin synthase-like enzyme
LGDLRNAKLLEAVLAHLAPKHSLFFDEDHPNYAHDFMHNKLLVADDTILTGSFNFSTNAMSNAENVIADRTEARRCCR